MNDAVTECASTNTCRILILDDHALSRRALLGAFRLRGHVCDEVDTAEAALAAIETFAPDVVLLLSSLTLHAASSAAKTDAVMPGSTDRITATSHRFRGYCEFRESINALRLRPQLHRLVLQQPYHPELLECYRENPET